MASNKRGRSKRKNKKQDSDGFLGSAGLALLFASAGLIVAFGLLWWQGFIQLQGGLQDAERAKLSAQYAAFYNGRIASLRREVGAIANSPDTLAALATYSPEQIAEVTGQIVDHHPYILRADIIEKDQAAVDLNAEVPISFAALDLIRRAETREFVGPEVSLNQRNLIYAAQPITPDGLVAGVLLVVYDAGYFLEQLELFDSGQGLVQIKQQFAGNPSTDVMAWGRADDDQPTLETPLVAGHWTLAFTATRNALPQIDAIGSMLMPFLVAWGALLGGIFLAFFRHTRLLRQDADELTDYASRLVRGRSARMSQYRLPVMQQIANHLAGYDKNASQTKDDNSESDDEEGDDLLANLDAPAKPAKPSKPTSDSDDDTNMAEDFLEVRSAAPDDNFGIEVSEDDAGPLDTGLNLDHEIFRAYDIRGITTDNLTEEVVYWIGRAFAAQAQSQSRGRAVVGRDGRHSSLGLEDSLTRGLTEGGIDVISIGQVPTPMLYYATYALDTGTGIMITGSHNPPEYNGLKMMIGGVTLAEEAIQTLKQRIIDNQLSEGVGDVEQIDLDDNYIDKVMEDIAIAQPPKVVVDCGNGVAGKIAPRLLEELGCEVVPLYCEVDGDFPNHHPDPAEPENLEDLITVVKAEQADLGLAFDGDGDRLGVVTNSGQIIWPDKLMMLFSQDIVSRNPGADIIYDVKCSRHLNNQISELGGRPIMWKTGHSHIKAKMRETGALLGGEFSGHICFGERWYGFDDALYSAARLLEIVGSDTRDLDELFSQFPVTFTTPEIKINTTEQAKFEIMERLANEADFGDGTITSIDGIRVDFADGWGLIRPSNTSPVLSLRFEADGPAALERIQDQFQTQLSKIDSALKFRG